MTQALQFIETSVVKKKIRLLIAGMLLLVSLSASGGESGALLWSTVLVNRAGLDGSAAIAPDGTIYITSADARLYALDPGGRKKWAFRTGSDIKSSPAIGDDGTIYFGSRDRKLYAVTPEGQQKWSFL